MRPLWPAAPLLASVLAVLALAPAGEVHATTLVSPADFAPSGLGDGDYFRLLFVTSDTTDLVPTKTSFVFFDNFVQNAVRDNGPASLTTYADQFKAVVSCGRTSAQSHTFTYTSTNTDVPIYWLEGGKVADNYREFWTAGWDSNDPRNESGQAAGSVLVWTGTAADGSAAGVSRPNSAGSTACSNLVTFGQPDTSEKEMNYFIQSSSSEAALYGLSTVFRVSFAPSTPATPTVESTTHDTARITWEAPQYGGATPISGYDVQVKPAGGSWAESTPDHQGTSTSHTITGLSPDTEYQVRVQAKNSGSGGSETVHGPWSNAATFQTKITEPSAPDRPAVESTTNNTARITWDAPQYSGATPISGYDVQVKPDGGSWTESTPDHRGTSTSHTITGLSPHTEYQVRVHAKNHGAGGSGTESSTWSPTATFQTKTAIPSAPGQPTVHPHTTSADVIWTSPAWVGGPPLNDYDLHYRNPGGPWIDARVSGTSTTHTLTGLAVNTEYQVRVHAKNTAGTGPWSAIAPFRTLSSDTPVGTTVPADWPLIPRGLGAGHQFRLMFVADGAYSLAGVSNLEQLDRHMQSAARNGAAGLASYADQFHVLASCGRTDARHHTGTTYTSNNFGVPIYWVKGDKVADHYRDFYDGSWDSLDARSHTGFSWERHVPSYATPQTWTGTNNDGTASRHDACAAGNVIVNNNRCYERVCFNNPGGSGCSAGHETRCPHVAYGYADADKPGQHFWSGTLESRHYRALYGMSPVFVVSDAPGAPGAPSVSGITHNSAQLSWRAPAVSGTTEIFDYNVQVKPAGGSWVGSTPYHWGTDTTHTLTGLSPDTEYQVRVYAKNHGSGGSDVGYGPASRATTFHTLEKPIEVPSNWQLIPRGVNPGDVFRLLFVTSDTRTAVILDDDEYDPGERGLRWTASSNYHNFVQNAADSGHPALDQFSDDFRAIVSTYRDHAIDNAHMRHSAVLPGVPVYWVNGDKVADDYADFYDGCWDSNNPRNENGDRQDGEVLTGSYANGTKHANFIGHVDARYGLPAKQCKEISVGNDWGDQIFHVYGISPVFQVSILPPAPTGLTVTSITHSTAVVTWNAPTASGATEIFDYNVQVRQAGGTWFQSVPYHWGTDTTHKLIGLSDGTTYQVRVYAKNHGTGGSEIGYGPATPPVTFHTRAWQ